MTEKSYFWDGTVTGDAVYAPYDKEEFNLYVTAWCYSSGSDILVVPNYLEDLNPTPYPNSQSVSIAPGAAIIKGYLYKLTANKSFSIVTPTTRRIDSIVLRVDYRAQTVRLALKEGTTTSLPPLVQIVNDTWEEEIIRVFSDSNGTLVIEDRRKFLHTNFIPETYAQDINLLKNGEFMAFEPTISIPSYWDYTTSASSEYYEYPQNRGRSLEISNEDYITQYINISKDIHTFSFYGVVELTDTLGSYPDEPYYMLVEITGIRENGEETNSIIRAAIRVGTTAREFWGTVYFEEDDLISLKITIKEDDIPSAPEISTILLVAGYHTGGIRHTHELLMVKRAGTDAAWSDTAKSDGTTTIDFGTDYQSAIGHYFDLVPLGPLAVIIRLRGRDSASAAAADSYLRTQGWQNPFNTIYGSCEVAGVTNNVYREIQCIVPFLRDYNGFPRLRYIVEASGALTFDATAEIIGMIT